MSAGKIYSAIYSGIQVYEMMIHGIATMVRGSDSYLNATQILKVAGIEKTKRSKILEREVLTGEHEKVQGGYGKYQGTWIPFEKGKELAKNYNVYDAMLSLFEFDPSTIEHDELPTKEQAQMESRNERATSTSPPSSPASIDQHLKTSSFFNNSSSSLKRSSVSSISQQQSRKKMKIGAVLPTSILPQDSFYEHHRSILMNLFLSDDPDDVSSAFDLLTNDINIDLVIDEQGHTALHWAAALGRVKIVESLIKSGANICRVNYEGETPLMRAVMITCAYENKCFSELVDLMTNSISVVDNKGRTVLHHIALTAAVEGYTDAAIYYMKKLVKGAPKRTVLKNILNIKDKFFYESALAIVLRVECQEIADILIKQGALDPIVPNIEREEQLEFVPTQYEPSARGQDLMKSITFMVDKLEEDHQEQLRKRDLKAFEMKKEMNMLKYELKESQRRLKLPLSMQLAEAQRKIQVLEKRLSAEDAQVAEAVKTEAESSESLLDDTLTEKSQKERRLDKKIKSLQTHLETGSKTLKRLRSDFDLFKSKANEREMEYRRLIAASCNIPIEKVDMLVKPLTLAIESDPLDLDMNRVIGFMEKMRNRSSSSISVNSPYETAVTPAIATTPATTTTPAASTPGPSTPSSLKMTTTTTPL